MEPFFEMSEHSLELWDACASGNLDLAKFLLNSNLSLDMNWRGLEKGDTPLHRACRFGHLHLVEILLKLSTVDVNAENAGLATPFLIACQNGHTEVVLLLMADMRVDLNKPAKDLTTPLGLPHKMAALTSFGSCWPLIEKFTPRPSVLLALRLGMTKLRLRLVVCKQPETLCHMSPRRITSSASKMVP